MRGKASEVPRAGGDLRVRTGRGRARPRPPEPLRMLRRAHLSYALSAPTRAPPTHALRDQCEMTLCVFSDREKNKPVANQGCASLDHP